MIKVLCRFFEKKLRKKLSCGKFLGVFKNSTLDGCCQSSGVFCFNYAIGVCGLKFNTTMPEIGCRHCRPFLKKGSVKNFPTGKVFGYFSKIVRSIEMCSRLSDYFIVKLRRQQIYTVSAGERLDLMKGSLV